MIFKEFGDYEKHKIIICCGSKEMVRDLKK